MGNTNSSSSRRSKKQQSQDIAATAQKVVGDFQKNLRTGIQRLEEEDHPAAALLDSVCGGFVKNPANNKSFDSDDDSHTISEEETTVTEFKKYSYDDTDDDTDRFTTTTMDNDTITTAPPPVNLQKQPLASSFAKRCYFTKAGIGGTTQHYEGLTLNGNVILMLASAMKLKGCPTICDEDLRRVEQTFPNQFSRLPDELLLSSGWRRISKYCHFSNKAIPDGIPFFHSKQRLHNNSGYYFLLAAAIGMIRPMDVEPLTRDTLVLLETDYPNACDTAPRALIEDPDAWILVDKFCFFSGGPINTEEDVYYEADFDGNPIFMLAFLSPNLTPTELYKLDSDQIELTSTEAVKEVERVYDLTERDFDDLKLYHLGPCRALPQYILQPQAWRKVLPPPFVTARNEAMARARQVSGETEEYYPYDQEEPSFDRPSFDQGDYAMEKPFDQASDYQSFTPQVAHHSNRYPTYESRNGRMEPPEIHHQDYDVHEDGPSMDAHHLHFRNYEVEEYDRRPDPMEFHAGMDPPEDEPPSLRKPSRFEPPEDPQYDESDQYTEPFAEPHNSYGSVDEYYDDGRLSYREYEQIQMPQYAENYAETAGYGQSGRQLEPIQVSSPMSDGDFTDPTIDTFSPRRLPPASPARSSGSQLSAVKAQDMTRRNQRQNDALTPLSQPSASTWETDGTSEFSSVWTDNEPDRTSRRALILQMAKARMKNAGAKHHEDEKKIGDGRDVDLRGELD